jgi:uncharacterized protein (UPF0332 family)
MLPDEDKRALAQVRYEHASECLRAANALFAADDLKGAVNRAYYAVFHAMRSVLALDEIDRKHHSAIIAEFRSRYVKTGVFEKEYSKLIQMLSEYRNGSDYNDFYIISRDEVSTQIDGAKGFLDAVRAYLDTLITEHE